MFFDSAIILLLLRLNAPHFVNAARASLHQGCRDEEAPSV